MSRKNKTTATKEEATPALVPKLRFPEFRDAEGWDATILGELSEVVRGGSPRPIDGFMTTSADGLNWLKIGDVDKEAKFVTQTAEKVRREALSKTRVVNPGDLILSNSMSFGRPYILQITTCIHDGWIAITRISKKTDRDFLYYLISAPGSQSYFVDNAAGSGGRFQFVSE
jgi:type I restriction enzyme S subunit